MISALYVERGGPYFSMPDVDPWGVERDARTYAGPWPVVAHPPCGPWGRLKHLYKGNEHDCAPSALVAVRTWGGVLEHPAHSLLWKAHGLPMPGHRDAYGFTLEVDQVAWGHVARKRSWLYICDVGHEIAAAGIRAGGVPTHWVCGFRERGGLPKHRCKTSGSATPPGIKICSAQQRRRTPPAFARWLVDLALTAGFGG